jgi:hypothetical protein
MPLSVEEVISHNNFSSNNRIKRSTQMQKNDYSVQDIIKQLFNIKRGKLKRTVSGFLDKKYSFVIVLIKIVNNFRKKQIN